MSLTETTTRSEPDLFSFVPPPPEPTMVDKFIAFHRANPHVYVALVDAAWSAKLRGRDKYSLYTLYEVVRWNFEILTGGDEFKLNNNWRAYYARLIMYRCPGLAGFFDLREAQDFDPSIV